jgi:hypothetical protein
MARKDTLKSYVLLNAQSTASDFNTYTNPTNIDYLDNVGIQVVWTGTTVGTLEVYGSNDTANVQQGKYPTNWSKFEFGATINVDTTNSDLLIHMNQVPYSWIALKYTATSGTGTITAKLTVKMVGG